MKITEELIKNSVKDIAEFKDADFSDILENLDIEKIVDYVRYISPENEVEQNDTIEIAIRKQLVGN